MSFKRNNKYCFSTILAGVHCANFIAQLWQEDSIDLYWDQYRKNNPQDDPFDCCWDSGIQLYGRWIIKGGHYSPSPRGEMSAVFDPDTNTVQVVKSKYIIRCHLCSLCYPNQGDIDTAGDQWAYCLPPYLMNEEWIRENSHRIIQRTKSSNGSYYWKRWKE